MHISPVALVIKIKINEISRNIVEILESVSRNTI